MNDMPPDGERLTRFQPETPSVSNPYPMRGMTDTPILETPRQLAARVGLSERQVRNLMQTRQLAYVCIGSRLHIPTGAFDEFLAKGTVKPWADETKVQGYGGSQSGGASISPGPSAAGAASARLARQTANELKRFSGNGSTRVGAEQGRVIPLKSS